MSLYVRTEPGQFLFTVRRGETKVRHTARLGLPVTDVRIVNRESHICMSRHLALTISQQSKPANQAAMANLTPTVDA